MVFKSPLRHISLRQVNMKFHLHFFKFLVRSYRKVVELLKDKPRLIISVCENNKIPTNIYENAELKKQSLQTLLQLKK